MSCEENAITCLTGSDSRVLTTATLEDCDRSCSDIVPPARSTRIVMVCIRRIGRGAIPGIGACRGCRTGSVARNCQEERNARISVQPEPCDGTCNSWRCLHMCSDAYLGCNAPHSHSRDVFEPWGSFCERAFHDGHFRGCTIGRPRSDIRHEGDIFTGYHSVLSNGHTSWILRLRKVNQSKEPLGRSRPPGSAERGDRHRTQSAPWPLLNPSSADQVIELINIQLE